ncbi:MAG TPA: hypothetical protein VHP33_25040 [Polyangiaceae bacterium]|nr:hypothetical protein [Polyangiaceae bacterium]
MLVAPLALALACSVDPGGDEPRGSAGSLPIAGSSSGGGGSVGQAANGGSTNASSGSASGGVATAGSAGAAGPASSGSNTGGGASAGGSTSAAGTSSGGSGGSAPTGCMGVTSKFCDDFEAQAAGMPPKGDFTVDAKAGAVLVDTTKAYSGTKALHITTPKPGSTSFMKFTKQFPMNDFHGRAMFFLTRIPTAEIHWDLIDALSQNGQHWEIGGMYGKFIFVVDPPDHALTSNTFPTGKWFCLQWQFKYGGANADNTFLAKQDNQVLDKGMFTGPDPSGTKWAAGTWQNLNIGWTNYGGSDVDIEEWIDDLALGDAPIPCPAAP